MGYMTDLISTVRGSQHLVGVAARGHRIHWIYAPGHPEDWEDTVIASRQRALVSEVLAKPVGLTEPFKVRTITRGSADPYHLARRWQPYLWAPLRDHETTRLVAGPTTHEQMASFLGKVDPDCDRSFVSGDYESATDYLNPELSEHCLEEICRRVGVPWDDTLVLLRCLTRHTFPGQDREQARGQLMGSPISFPVLTVLNLAFTRFAVEFGACPQDPSRTRQSLDDHPILVNGDDVLFRAHPWEYRAWKTITRLGGLRPSLGKNQVSSRFFTINSELWKVDIERPTPQFPSAWYRGTRLVIPQMGLVYGSVKGGTSAVEEQPLFHPGNTELASSRASCIREFLKQCPDPIRGWDFAWKATKVLRESTPSTMAWCLPEWLGGLGLPLPPKGHRRRGERKAKSGSLCVARFIKENWNSRTVRRWWTLRKTSSLPAYLEMAMDSYFTAMKAIGVRKLEGTESEEEYLPLPLQAFYPTGPLGGKPDRMNVLKKLTYAWSTLVHEAWQSRMKPLHAAEITYTPPKMGYPTGFIRNCW